jgi:predicted PurR-regulated permease PerM
MSTSAAAAVLAASDTGKGSPIGLFVVLLLVIATYLLYRSMSGHIRRLPEKFPGYGDEDSAGPEAAEQPVASPPPSQSSQSDSTRSGPEGPA